MCLFFILGYWFEQTSDANERMHIVENPQKMNGMDVQLFRLCCALFCAVNLCWYATLAMQWSKCHRGTQLLKECKWAFIVIATILITITMEIRHYDASVRT